MQSKAKFLCFQGIQLSDKNEILLQDDVVYEESILRFDDNGYLHGAIERDDGYVEYYKHGMLHGNPAVVSQDLKHLETWENGKLKKIVSSGQEFRF